MINTTLVHLDSKQEIDKNNIIELAKRIRKVLGSDIIGKEIALHQKIEDGTHTYEFKLNKEFVTEEEIEVLVSIFYHQIPTDFDIEFETEVQPDLYIPDSVGEVEVVSESAKHEMWVSMKLKEGWRYGLEFCEKDKTDPKLKPYYQLTQRQLKSK